MAQSHNLRTQVLIPLGAVLTILGIAFVAAFYLHFHHLNHREFNVKLQKTQLAIQALIDGRAQKLALALDGLIGDERLRNDMLLRDRPSLLGHSKPLFDKLRDDYGISQLHFYEPGRQAFLHLLQPEQFGEVVDRQTLLAATRSDALSYGVELGPIGDLTLRVVTPWRQGDHLVGYVELGEEVADLVLQIRRVFGLDVYVGLAKEHVTEEGWQLGKALLGHEGSWHEGNSVAIVAQTLPGIPTSVLTLLTSDTHQVTEVGAMTPNGKHHFLAGAIPIRDVSGRVVGKVALLDDITGRLESFWENLRYVALVTAASVLVLIAFFFEIVHRGVRGWQREKAALLDEQLMKDKARLRTIEELEQGLLLDKVTSLPNRALFLDRLNQQIHVSQRERRSFAVVVAELTNLRDLRDTIGETLLEQLLHQVSFRFKEGLRRSDTIARCGPDQFAVLLPTVDLNLAVTLAQKISRLLTGPYSISELYLDLKTDIGISLFPYHGQDPETLLRRAEAAQRDAAHERTPYAVYDSRKDSVRQQQLSLVTDLQRALAGDELMLYYFPCVDMRSGRVNGVEALLRWRHAEQGYIAPEEVIALADKTGLIKPLNRWILNRVLRQQANWLRSGIDLPLSINAAATALTEGSFAADLQELLKQWEVPASSIVVEISERTIAIDPRRMGNTLKTLDEIGVKIAMDDVGAGTSALPLLKSLPVAQIKIDQSLVYNLPDNQNNAAFVRSAIELAHGLGLTVAAEGVKNKAIWDALVRMKCDVAQGYHICQPTTSGAFECWLVNSKYGLDNRGQVCSVPADA